MTPKEQQLLKDFIELKLLEHRNYINKSIRDKMIANAIFTFICIVSFLKVLGKL